jgi:hypothetical protein
VYTILGKCRLRCIFFAACLITGLILGLFHPDDIDKKSLRQAINDELSDPVETLISIMRKRLCLLADSGDPELLKDDYDLSGTAGYWAWEREKKRIEYFEKWLELRRMSVVEVSAQYEIDYVSLKNQDNCWVEITELITYSYVYEEDGDEAEPHIFGSRSVHAVDISACSGRWKIAMDWYVDPLGEEAFAPGKLDPQLFSLPGAAGEDLSPGPGSYDRRRAIEYAVRYSGVRVFPEAGKYNPDYRLYTYLGGDCCNFASQILNAGGIPQGYGWYYSGEGSLSWVQSEAFVWFLLLSGVGQQVFRGTGDDLMRNIQNNIYIVPLLQPGDVIAYELDGEILHVAVVAGYDPKGYITIVSHTADRLFFPWDLGWDESTVYWFIKITY